MTCTAIYGKLTDPRQGLPGDHASSLAMYIFAAQQ